MKTIIRKISNEDSVALFLNTIDAANVIQILHEDGVYTIFYRVYDGD